MAVAGTIEKNVLDSRVYKFDYSLWTELISGEQLTGAFVTVSPNDNTLTMGTVIVVPAINQAQLRISGGTAGTTYTLTCRAITSGGDSLVQEGLLAVTA